MGRQSYADESLIDILERKDSATDENTLQKLLGKLGVGRTPNQQLRRIVKESLEKANNRPPLSKEGLADHKATASLAEFVINKIMSSNEDPIVVYRRWAYACGKVLGLIVSLAIRPSKQRTAVQQIADEASRVANDVGTVTMNLGFREQEAAPKPSEKATAGNSSSNEQLKKQKLNMAKDLESQATIEASAEAKDALIRMAKILRKEVELEESLKAH